MKCSKCGIDLNENTKFCTACGAPVEQALPVEPVVPLQPVQQPMQFNMPTMQPVQQPKKPFNPLIIVVVLLVIVVGLLGTIVATRKNGKGSSQEKTEEIVELTGGTRTIMIYTVGSNLESESEIVTADLNAINQSSFDAENVNVLVMAGGTKIWHNDYISASQTQIYKLENGHYVPVKSYGKNINFGESSTLIDLLEYGYNNYKTDKYDLIVYDHGGALEGAVYDDLYGGDVLSLEEFASALASSPFNKKNKLETVLFRTCLNGNLEMANVFKNYAQYMIASEEASQGSSITPVLGFIAEIKKEDNAIDYGKKYIEKYEKQINTFDYYNGVKSNYSTYSIVNLSKIDKLNIELNKFIKGIDIRNNFADIVRLRANMYQYGYTQFEADRYDMVDLLTLINGLSTYSSVNNADLIKAFNDAVVYNWTTGEVHNGIAIYFPYKGSPRAKNLGLNAYKTLEVGNDYAQFINDFRNISDSNTTSSFAGGIRNNEINIDLSNKNEFSITLTEEQAKEFAEAVYMVFVKNDDGTYSYVYSSDNAKLDKTTLKTNISNNMIKIKSDTAKYVSREGEYVPIIERTRGGVTIRRTTAVINNWKKADMDNWISHAVNVFFEMDKKGTPYISQMTIIAKEDETINGTAIKMDDYSSFEYYSGHYKIKNKDGSFNDKFESTGTLTGFGYSSEDTYEFYTSPLDDGDYVCVFRIWDIYGNSYYSNVVEVK